MVKKIRAFVSESLTKRSNKKRFLELGTVSKKQADFIKKETGLDLAGCKRYIDNYGVLHTINTHGNSKIEQSRGQMAITTDDFEKILEIVKRPDKISYVQKNRRNQPCFLYQKNIDGVYFVVDSVRVRNGNKTFFETMYKRKSPLEKGFKK